MTETEAIAKLAKIVAEIAVSSWETLGTKRSVDLLNEAIFIQAEFEEKARGI